MKGKELRTKRIRDFFLSSAADIVRSGGAEQLTIRNVADKAGYNSATMYQYFENFEHCSVSSLSSLKKKLPRR